MNRSAVASAAMLVGLCGACSVLVPLSDYDVPDGDAGSTRAVLDATPADHAAAADAGDTCIDAGDFCQQHLPYTFCNDFDMGLDVSSGWSSIAPADASVLSRSSAAARSCPSSLQAIFFPHDGGATGGSVAIAIFPPAAAPLTSVQCEYDWRVQQLSSVAGDSTLFTQFQFSDTVNVGYDLGTSGELTLTDGTTAHPLTTLSTLGSWHHLSIAFSLTASSSTYAFALDGQTATGTLAQAIPAEPTFDLVLGPLDDSDESGGWWFDFDNVICR